MAYLVIRDPGRMAFTFTLGDECAIGRGPENHLVLGDRKVSRLHAVIAAQGDVHVIQDQQSRHGTLVNGERAAPGQRLCDRDHIQIGSAALTYHEQRSEAPIFDSVTAAARPSGADPHARRLRALYDAATAIGGQGGPIELAGRLLDGVMAALDAGMGVVALVEPPARRVVRGAGAEELAIDGRLLGPLIQRRECMVVRDGRGSAVGAPLSVGDRALGFVYLVRPSGAAPFAVDERDFLNAFAHLTAAALSQAARQAELARLAESFREAQPGIELLGESPPMLALRASIERFAAAPGTAVLIRGESGTGKELVARLLHARSPRADRAFVAVNCAAIPDPLLESELFGHARGAFTGADRARRGKFALADGGTLFLDEVGDLSASAQAKVLRAIEEGELHVLGEEQPIQVDVRVISATHKPIEDEIAAGRFRADLYYRLSVVDVILPPLRERGEDVRLLADVFLARAARRMGMAGKRWSGDALVTLRRYSWPGNVRQLANEVERALLLSDGDVVDLDDLRARIVVERPAQGRGPATTFKDAERELVARALAGSGGNIKAAAQALGMSRNTLYRKMAKHKLS